MFDFEILFINNGVYLVVRDKKFDGCVVLLGQCSEQRWLLSRVYMMSFIGSDDVFYVYGRSVFYQSRGNFGIGFGDGFVVVGDGENMVIDVGNNFVYVSFDVSFIM